MTIYKFRVMYEDDDSIFRDVEIKPSQTISDFESVIISSYNLPATSVGQFYKSNDSWHRVKQLLTVVEPTDKKEKSKPKTKVQSLPMLVAFIDDPHQKFIYDYKGTQEFVFLIELLTLTGAEKATVIYPVCVRQQGPSPFKKEELVAHYSKVADEGDAEDQRIDDDEVDLGSMGQEGEEEDIAVEEEAETDVVSDEGDDAEDVAEESDEEEFTEEEFGGDFPEGDDKD
ncbi:MAG: hypothetical protein WBB36_06705 [Chitinophagales bacterium]